MFDTMTMTKTVGAVCGSLLVLMLVGWAGNSLHTVGGKEHGGEHAEGELTQAYTIDTGEAAAPAEGGGETVDVAALLAAGDAAAGEAAAAGVVRDKEVVAVRSTARRDLT